MRASPQKPAFLGAVLLVAALMGGRVARAQEAEYFPFIWQAPVDCPSSADVRDEIARLLGGKMDGTASARLQVRAVVTQAQIWSVAIETEAAGRVGQRALQAGTCRELANATALIIALMIDPDAVAAHAPQTPRPQAPAPSPPASPPVRPLGFQTGIVVAGTQGILPAADVGLGGSLGLSMSRWRVDVRASYGLRQDQRATAPVPPGGYGRFHFFSALLAGCFDLGGPRLAWGPCAVGEFGVVSAKGGEIDRALPAHVPSWAVGAGGYAVIPLARRWAIPIHLDALLPLHRSEYVFRDSQGQVSARVFKAAPVGVRASVGMELHF